MITYHLCMNLSFLNMQCICVSIVTYCVILILINLKGIEGKLDRWEWDSGARDLSPVPQPPARMLEHTNTSEESAIQVGILMIRR